MPLAFWDAPSWGWRAAAACAGLPPPGLRRCRAWRRCSTHTKSGPRAPSEDERHVESCFATCRGPARAARGKEHGGGQVQALKGVEQPCEGAAVAAGAIP